MLRLARIVNLSLASRLKFVRRSFPAKLSRRLIAILLMGAMATLSVPPAMARSAVAATIDNSPTLIGYTRSALAFLWFTFSGQQEGGTPQGQQPVDPPTEQELEARVTRLEMNPQGEVLLLSGQTQAMSAIPFDADDNILHGLIVRWASDNSQVVSISEDGLARAGVAGTATLTATAGPKQGTLSVTVIESPAAGVASGRRGGAKIINASWSSSSRPHSGNRPRLLAHGARLMRAALAPMPEQPYDADPLPDDETDSLYTASNAVGAPPGRTPQSAINPPAAIRGRENAGSSNFTFGLPLLNLPGRGGLDVSLVMSYNSRLWNKSITSNGTTHMSYDVDNGWPAPGFRLGYGQLEYQGGFGYTLVDPDGTRHGMLLDGTQTVLTTNDGTFITYNPSNHIATYPDGTQVQYGAEGTTASGAPGKRSYPVKITDRNGNFILITYRAVNSQQIGPQIASIRDTLARIVYFKYANGGNQITSITAPRYQNGTPDRGVVRFIYDDLTLNSNFTSTISVTAPTTPLKVIKYAYFPGTKSGYRFDYSSFGMINNIVQLRGMVTDAAGIVVEGQPAATTKYYFPADDTPTTALSDAPKFIQRIDSYWSNGSLVSLTPTNFTVNTSLGITTITAPDSSQTVTTTIKSGQWDDGLISKVEYKKGGVTLSKSVYSWETNPSVSPNPRINKLDLTNDASPTPQTKSIVYSYGKFNNVTAVYECDFNVTCTPQDAAQKALRRTETTYVEDTNWTDRGLIHLPKTVKVFAGTSTSPASQTDFNYDEYIAPAGTPLTPRTDIIMHDDPISPVTNQASDKRGNVTSVTTYSNAGASLAADKGGSTRKASYDIAGNMLTQEVDCCQQKVYAYTTTYKYAYSTQLTRGGDMQLTVKATYDYNTGLVMSTSDENNQSTNVIYDWATLRPLEVDRPDSGYTKYAYEDGLPSYVQTTTLLDTSTTTGDRTVESLQYKDGLGRVVRTFGPLTTDGQTANVRVTNDVEYDSMGRLFRTSNPYYSSGPGSAVNPSGLWTKRIYDGLGRIKTVTFQDNNTASFAYAGEMTTATDQGGKQRRRKTDALGRLVRLDEPDDAGSLGDPATPTRATSYEYDALDNLTKVTQGGQVRSFKYDSRSRLIAEKQVEADATLNDLGQVVASGGSWTGVFKYDGQGLLTDSFDARGVHAQYQYDGLNRATAIDYSDTTPDIFYFYDQPVGSFSNKGHLTEVQTKVGTAAQTSEKYNYNKMGQIGQHSLTVDSGTPYTTKYLYNLAGRLTQETYPSLRAVKYIYDDAGRLANVADGVRTYVSGFKYASHGGLLEETWGENTTTPAVHSIDYNTRLQPKQIKLAVGGVEKQRLDYSYGEVNPDTGAVDVTKNTGQVARVEGFADGSQQWQQRYSYDKLGRLSLAGEYSQNSSIVDWRTDYDYDRFGNRYQSAGQSSGMPFIPVETGDISQTTNRFVSGMTYDKAGNVIVDNKFGGKQYKYDANGRQWWMANVDGTGAATSVYDGIGQRVQITAGGETRQMVYDVFGQLIAEYNQGVLVNESIYRGGQEVATLTGSQVQYLLRDHQGSARVALDASGTVVGRNDYLPFGDQVPPSGWTSSDDTQTRQRYAGLYRDGEGSLDHAWWRKYDSSSGRWTSPDPYGGSMNAADPQSFNRYSYVQNDPVNLTDPSGLRFTLNCSIVRDANDSWTCSLGWVDDPEPTDFSHGDGDIGGGGGGGGNGQIIDDTVDRVIDLLKKNKNCNQFLLGLAGATNPAAQLDALRKAGNIVAYHEYYISSSGTLEPFGGQLNFAHTVSDEKNGVRQNTGFIQLNADSPFFTGTLTLQNGQQVGFLQQIGPTSTLAGLNLNQIRDLTLLHEFAHVLDTRNTYNDNPKQVGQQKADNVAKSLNRDIRTACGF